MSSPYPSLNIFRSRENPDAFLAMAEAFLHRLKKWPPVTRPRTRGTKAAVLVCAGLTPSSPFASIEVGLMLHRAGRDVEFILDFSSSLREQSHRDVLVRLTKELEKHGLEVVDMGSAPDGTPQRAAAEEVLVAQAFWKRRGEEGAPDYVEQCDPDLEVLAVYLGKVMRMLETQAPTWLLICGGQFGLSALYIAAARVAGLSYSTYAASRGEVRVAHDGIAVLHSDLPAAFRELREGDMSRRQIAWQLAEAELERRAEAQHHWGFQVLPVEKSGTVYDIVVPLNLGWDGALPSGRQIPFVSVREWLESLLEWLGKNPRYSCCIRQHPLERFEHGVDDNLFSSLAQSNANPRIHFVAAEEVINTYDLLALTKAVLPWTSVTGIEGVLLGKPVIPAGNCFYDSLGFTWLAYTRREYFDLLEAALKGELIVSKRLRQEAELAFFLSQRCAVLATEFAPSPEAFKKWSEIAPENLWSIPENIDFQKALLSREPLASIRYRWLTAE